MVHFEIPADDLARAKKFYSGVFGWGTEEVPGMEYVMVRTTEVDPKTRMPKKSGAINGGVTKRMAEVKATTVTVDVADIDKAVQKVVKAGGRLVKEKQKVMDMGWIAYVKDTEGNVVGIWQTIKPQ